MSAPDTTFIKRPGTTDRGKDYEDLTVANLSLKYVTRPEIKTFYLSSNHSKFGAFDDVILEVVKTDGTELNYALQLKHLNNAEKGSLKNQLSGAKGNFSIQKYFDEFTKVKAGLTKSYRFVLYTNHKFDPEENATLKLSNGVAVKIVKIDQDLFDFSGTKGNCFQFKIIPEESDPTRVEDYTNFFNEFFLCTNQASIDDFQTETLNLFRDLFRCENEQAARYLEFIREWSVSDGKKAKLSSDFIREVIAVILLGPAIKPFDLNVPKNDKLDLLTSVISDFDVTLIAPENADQVDKTWPELNALLPDLDATNKIVKSYRLVLEPVTNIDDLDAKTKTVILWLLGKIPMIVTADATTIKAMQLVPNRKFIALGYAGPPNQKTLQKFTDLTSKTRELLHTFTCLLKNNKRISLEELLARDPKICPLLTVAELVKMALDRFKMADVVTLLARNDPTINSMCCGGLTPLHAACIEGAHELVRLIVDSDIDLNGASKDGDRPIFLATSRGYYDIVKLLLECQVNLNAANANGDTSVQVACARGDYELVKLLGQSGGDVNAADKAGVASLQVAASRGDLPIVKLLLDLGVDIDGSNKNGETALFLASCNGHSEVVRVLLEAKAKQVSNVIGNGALHVACSNGHDQVARILLEMCRGAGDGESDDDDDEHFDFYSVNVDSGNVKGNTPLLLACQKGFVRVVEVLLRFGANVNVRNAKGLSALDLARQKKHEDIVNLLENKL